MTEACGFRKFWEKSERFIPEIRKLQPRGSSQTEREKGKWRERQGQEVRETDR